MKTIELTPTNTEELTPEEFLRVYETEKGNIRSAKVIPSKLGDKDFASIIVIRKRPIYLQKHGRVKSYERSSK